jgi:hypothetical protein
MSADTENVDSELQSSLRESPSGVCHALGVAQRWPVEQTPMQLSARQRPVPNEKPAAWPANSGRAATPPKESAKCHVWTAPCWQGFFGG